MYSIFFYQVKVVEKYTPEKGPTPSPSSRRLVFGLHSPACKDEISPVVIHLPAPSVIHQSKPAVNSQSSSNTFNIKNKTGKVSLKTSFRSFHKNNLNKSIHQGNLGVLYQIKEFKNP